ncbi:2Fe-2S iron-sulfur cluster-binding protein [Candidatus Gromoviella agglomerans]|uniref:2Fe-2S iron-sulfur cluster-binding protein n=1 Tax=Candidatus Gromoviella agglomerans TaxID=2806609 RepID=UPI001E3C8ABC|nr:2Fe-2S iron-sulfur cluster-binding protein [Candidatus Gromoviella agglomerans]UFX98149.1 2Fe-2S ferredoxin [Candidatus Gromoviella agglomerans]
MEKIRSIEVKFVKVWPNGRTEEILTRGYKGQNLVDLAHENGLENDIIASCGCSCACATCHVVVDSDWSTKTSQNNPMTDQENAMLDLAFGVESTSRLGCQVKLTEELSGMVVKIPLVDGMF